MEAAPENPVEAEKKSGGLGDIIDRAQARLKSGIGSPAEDQDQPGEDEEEKPRWKRYTPAKQKEEIAGFLGTLLTVLLAAWSVPDELKPNKEETDALASVTTRLLLRHIDISGKLTRDALDLIGIVAVISGWYTRTAPAWREYRQVAAAKKAEGKVIDTQEVKSEEAPTPAPRLFQPRGGLG